MHIETKIRITDNSELRKSLNELFDKCDQIIIAKWAIDLSKHIFEISGLNYQDIDTIINGFNVNEEWQNGKMRMYDVRQAGFAVHKLAKVAKNIIEQNCLRVAGQAVATGHMKEHGMVASDYSIRIVNLLWPADIDRVEEERNWQIRSLRIEYEKIEKATKKEKWDLMIIKDNCRLHIDMNEKSQTLMYLSEYQMVRRIDKCINNVVDSLWIEIETKTRRKGYCKRLYLKEI
jgi:hypothetical protein